MQIENKVKELLKEYIKPVNARIIKDYIPKPN